MSSVCDDGWKPFTIDGHLKCFKVFGRDRLDRSAATCQKASAKLILPKNDQEFDDMVSLLKTLDIVDEDFSKLNFHAGTYIEEYAAGGIFVGLDVMRTSYYQPDYFNSQGETVSYFKWGPDNESDQRKYWNGVAIWIKKNGQASMVHQVHHSRFHIVCEKEPLPDYDFEGKSFK